MPGTALTGVASGYDPTVAVTTTGPAAGEPPAAAHVNTPAQDLLDAVAFHRENGLHTYKAVTTWTKCSTFDDTEGAGHAQARLYRGVNGELARVVNATWNETTSQWTREEAGLDSTREVQSNAGWVKEFYGNAAASPWADGAWVVNEVLDPDPAVGKLETPRTIRTTAGNIEATGVPVGSAGPGIVKAARLTSTGTAITSGQFADGTPTWGGAGLTFTPLANANDMAGSVEINVGAAAAQDPQFKMTFKDGTFTTRPAAVIVRFYSTTNAVVLPGQGYDVGYEWTATDVTVTLYTGATTPTAGDKFRFAWIVIA